jgi:hypothetical protein
MGKYQDFVVISLDLYITVDGNHQVEIYTHLLELDNWSRGET